MATRSMPFWPRPATTSGSSWPGSGLCAPFSGRLSWSGITRAAPPPHPPERPNSLFHRRLDYARRWGIEPMFSDFKTRGFGLEDSQIRYPDRLARLILVMTLALYLAVSTGQWDALHHATPAERRRPDQQPKRVLRSMTSWFTRGLRRIANLLQTLQPFPQLWSAAATDRW